MPLPQKRWFRIGDVAKHWAIPLSDIEDYALDEMLQLSVFVVDLPAEMGSWEGGRAGEGPALQDLPILNGPQPLLRGNLLEIFRDGQADPASFILDKQIGELRRRLNTTGDIHHRPIRPRWANQLRLDLAGTPERNEANVITALSCDEAFAGTLVFDEFRQEIMVARKLPWDDQLIPLPRPWADADDVRCAEWLQRREINVPPVVVSRSVTAVARDIRIHPVRDYLNGLVWDGVPRLDSWTLTYLGADDTPLNRAFGALWAISAIARIMQPGAKADHMLILEGPQGARKSTALKVLAGADWFTDELAEIGSKDAAQQMRGVWIIEIAELDAIGRAEVSRIKAFLSRTVDRYRPPYGRYVIDVPRQCVFAGSVNPDTYLRDETGNRRFWPVRCGTIDLDALRRDRDQLWAEAVVRYREGAIWWLQDPALIAMAEEAQEMRLQSDAWDGLIEHWLAFERRRVNRGYVGYDVRTPLRIGPPRRNHHRHVRDAQQLGRQHPAMAGDDVALLVDQDRHRPAKFPDRRRDLGDLLVGMGPGVPRVWHQGRHGPALDGVGRPTGHRFGDRAGFIAGTAALRPLSGHGLLWHQDDIAGGARLENPGGRRRWQLYFPRQHHRDRHPRGGCGGCHCSRGYHVPAGGGFQLHGRQ